MRTHVNQLAFRRLLAAVAAAASILPLASAYATSFTYTQDFDTLPTEGAGPTQFASPGWVDNSTLADWYFSGVAGSDANYFFGDGTPKSGGTLTGGIYDFGVASSANRSLGLVGTNGNNVSFGVELTNTTGATLTNATIMFDGLQYFTGSSVSKTLSFTYGIGGSNLTSATTADSNLNFLNPVAPNLGGNGMQVAPPANQTLSDTISGINWTAGSTLWLVWTLPGASKGPGLAIDNLSVSANDSADAIITWTGGTGNWNTTDSNWTGTSTTFSTGALVTFGNTGSGTVTIDAANVSPGSTTFSNSAGVNYTIHTSGGFGITGSGNVLVNGGGNVTFDSSLNNSFTGSVTVTNGSALNVNHAGDLGHSLTLDGGNLGIQSNLTYNNPVTVTANGTTISVANGTTASLGSITNHGALLVSSGTGTLTLSNNYSDLNSGTTQLTGGGTLEFAAPASSNDVTPIANTTNTFVGTILLSGVTRINFASNPSTINANLTYTGPTFVNGSGSINMTGNGAIINSQGDIEIDKAISLNPNSVSGFVANFGATKGETVGNQTAPSSTLTLAGIVSGSVDTLAFENNFGGGGGGLVDIAANNTVTANTINVDLNQQGVVKLDSATPLPSGAAWVFGDSGSDSVGALDLNGHNVSMASLASLTTSNGTPVVTGIANSNAATAATVTITGSATTTFVGQIGVDASNTTNFPNLGGSNNTNIALAVNGSGTLTLTNGNSTYSNGTTINGGTLIVANTSGSATGSGNVTLEAGAVRGTGIIGGSLTAATATAKSIIPGTASAPYGTLTVNGDLVPDEHTTFEFHFNAGSAHSQIDVGGGLDNTSTTMATIVDVLDDSGTSIPVGIYPLITYGGIETDNVNYTLDLPAGYTGHLDDTTTAGEVDLDITAAPPGAFGGFARIVPTPEPTSVGLLAFGAFGLLRRRRWAR
jgi:autotransporter-associated beta strand protein